MSRHRFPVGLRVVIAAMSMATLIGIAAAATPATSVDELRKKVVTFAGGPDALSKIHTFSYDFVFGSDPKAMMVHHHAYDADRGIYRYESSLADFAKTNFWKGEHWTTDPNVPQGKQLIAIYHYPRLDGTVYIDGKPLSGEENMRLLRRVNDSVENDRYFAFLPLIINRPSIHLDPVPPVDDKKYGRLEGFTAWSGTDKATNRTLWTLYMTSKGELVRTDIMVLNSPGPVTVYWEKWKQFGPVRMPQEHVIPSRNGAFRHDHIAINKPVTIEPPR